MSNVLVIFKDQLDDIIPYEFSENRFKEVSAIPGFIWYDSDSTYRLYLSFNQTEWDDIKDEISKQYPAFTSLDAGKATDFIYDLLNFETSENVFKKYDPSNSYSKILIVEYSVE